MLLHKKLLAEVLLLAVMVSGGAHAGGVESCSTPDSAAGVPVSSPTFYPFIPYRSGVRGLNMSARDIQFQWDGLYPGGLSASARTALDVIAQKFVLRGGTSAIAGDAGNLEAVYNYVHRQPMLDWNRLDPADSTAFRVGYEGDTAPLGGNNLDRSHADFYIFYPSRAVPTANNGEADGSFPSVFVGADEDVDTGHDSGVVLPDNSIMVRGPDAFSSIDTSQVGWTRVGGSLMVKFNHELQHSLPPNVLSVGGDFGSGATLEFYSAVAEAVGGISDTTARGEVPYTWPLLSNGTGNSEAVVRAAGSNYQGRTAFAAYVAYNFLGADTSRTLVGMTDDLLYRWMKPNSRTLATLRDGLTDANCGTCVTKSYLRLPDGSAMPPRERMALIHHNWRVANFVNNPGLAEGQYGYPAFSGFSPARHQKAWQSFDGAATDDIIALPAVQTLTSQQLTRDLVLKGTRAVRGNTYPMTLVPYAANYWVLRAGGGLTSANRELVVHITPTACFRCRTSVVGAYVNDARLMASATAYSVVDPGPTDETMLWKFPSAAVWTSAVQSVIADSVAGGIDLVIPDFGATHKAVVVVLTATDGKLNGFTNLFTGTQPYVEALPYRLEIGVRAAPFSSITPTNATDSPSAHESAPAWSPSGSDIVFAVAEGNAAGQSQIYGRRLDMDAAVPQPKYLVAPQSKNQLAPDWSARGDIAFTAEESSAEANVWVKRVGAALSQLTSLAGREDMAAFQPDGQGLAYVHTPAGGGPKALRWVSLDGFTDILLATLGTGDGGKRPRWTADGSRVLITLASDANRLYSVSRSGGALVREAEVEIVARNIDPALNDKRWAFATDATFLNFGPSATVNNPTGFGFRSCSSSPTGFPANRLALVDTTSVARDTSFRFVVSGLLYDHPRISPDGTRVLYQAEDAVTHATSIRAAQFTWNHAPHFANLGDVGIPACVPFQMFLSATDPDGEAVTYKALQLPSGAQFINGNTIRIQNPQVGETFSIIRALDASGGVDSRVIRISVYDDGNCGDPLVDGDGGCGACLTTGSNMTVGEEGVATGQEAEASYLNGALPGQWFSQIARAGRVSTLADGSHELSLRATMPGLTSIDHARLWVLDHPDTVEAAAVSGGVMLIADCPSLTASGVGGEDWLAGLATSTSGGGSSLVPAGTVVALTASASDSASGVAIECARQGASSWGMDSGIEVQVPDGGAWRTAAYLSPRRGFDLLGARMGGWHDARIVFNSDTRVRRVMATRDAAVESHLLSLDPTGTNIPNGLPMVSGVDNEGLPLGPGDALELRFPPVSTTTGLVRSYFLELRASYVPPTGAWQSRTEAGSGVGSSAYAFHQNQPNPFRRQTFFRFALPHASRVSIEVFDSQGRRVRSVVDEPYPPGNHAAVWDGAAEDGIRLSPGVYHVRMTAGAYRSQVRAVLLPDQR